MFELYRNNEDAFAKVQLVLLMLGMGPGLAVRDFFEMVRRPWSFVVAFCVQMLAMPFVAELLTRLFRLDEGFALGLILVACMPGGSLSKVFAFLGRGNMPLSISLTFFSTLATIVTVPIYLKLLASKHVPEGFSVPASEVVSLVALYLFLPMAIGMLAARLWPQWKDRFARTCLRLGFLAVLVIVVCSMGSGRIKPLEPHLLVPTSIIVFCLLSMQLTMLPFRLLRWPSADCFAAGVEATMRNMNLALLLWTLLPNTTPEDQQVRSDVLYMILFFAGAALVVSLPLALRYRRKHRPAASTV
jgi:BASS family bile acid:Na+ symporter